MSRRRASSQFACDAKPFFLRWQYPPLRSKLLIEWQSKWDADYEREDTEREADAVAEAGGAVSVVYRMRAATEGEPHETSHGCHPGGSAGAGGADLRLPELGV